MTKIKAHAILDRIRSGEARFVSLAETNQALERTGDICGLFSEPLRFDGNQPCHDRPCQTHDTPAEVGFSYSKYLDYSKTEEVTQ